MCLDDLSIAVTRICLFALTQVVTARLTPIVLVVVSFSYIHRIPPCFEIHFRLPLREFMNELCDIPSQVLESKNLLAWDEEPLYEVMMLWAYARHCLIQMQSPQHKQMFIVAAGLLQGACMPMPWPLVPLLVGGGGLLLPPDEAEVIKFTSQVPT